MSASPPAPLYTTDGNRFVPSPRTAGPWSPDAQHGGPPAGLLTHCIETFDNPDGEMFPSRVTVELLRPVPLTPLTVSVRTTRPGRKVQLVEASLWSGPSAGEGSEVCRAVGLRIRRNHIDLPAVVLTANAEADRREALPAGPEDGVPKVNAFPDQGFHADGADLRFVRGAIDQPGPGTMWARLLQPVLDDLEPSGVVRAVTLSDFGNAVSSVVPMDAWSFINADLTVSLFREPVGEWICLDGVGRVSDIGVGLALCALHDLDGPIGRSAASLLIAPR